MIFPKTTRHLFLLRFDFFVCERAPKSCRTRRSVAAKRVVLYRFETVRRRFALVFRSFRGNRFLIKQGRRQKSPFFIFSSKYFRKASFSERRRRTERFVSTARFPFAVARRDYSSSSSSPWVPSPASQRRIRSSSCSGPFDLMSASSFVTI